MPARIRSNLFLKVLWAVIFNFRLFTFKKVRFKDLYSGLIKTPIRDKQIIHSGKKLSVLPCLTAKFSRRKEKNFCEEKVSFRLKGNQHMAKTTIYSVVLLIGWHALTDQKWLPSMWSKNLPDQISFQDKNSRAGKENAVFSNLFLVLCTKLNSTMIYMYLWKL